MEERVSSITRLLYCVECPQCSIRLEEHCMFLSINFAFNYFLFQCCIYVYMSIKTSYLLTYLLNACAVQ